MKGFTLMEVLVSTLIFSFILLAIFGALDIGDTSFKTDVGFIDLQQEIRLAMHGMVREIRQSRAADITISDSGASINFLIPDVSNSISYYLSGNQLIREHPAETTKVIGRNINSLNFSISGSNLQISMNAKTQAGKREIYFPSKEAGLEKFIIEKVGLRNG